MRNYIIIAFVFFISINQITAQQDLKTKLEGKETLGEIMNIVDQHYEGKSDNWRGENGEAPKLKHWKRWEWYMSGRLGPNNELVKIQDSLIVAKKELEKMFKIDPSRNVNSAWTSVGPASTTSGIGRADRIAFHPSNPDIFYVATPAGGLWRTTNGGSSWTPLTDDIPSVGISGVVVDWNNPSTIYILTGDGDSANIGGFVFQFGYARTSIGVLKSTDSGATWNQTGSLGEVPFLPFRLVQSPTSANTLLAATSEGVFRTTDSGSTWEKTLNDDIYDIEFKPGSATVYASSNDKIYYSLFAGNSWAESTLDVNPINGNRIELAVTPARPNYVYALVGRTLPPTGVYGGTYRSTNSGLSFSQRSTTPNILGVDGQDEEDGLNNASISRYAHSLAVSNTDENMVVTGGIRIWNSSNGGITYPVEKSGYHSDIHELAYNPLDGKLYSCNDGGVYVSIDDGESWTPFLFGFRTSQIFHMAGTALDNNYFLIGLQDNGVKLRSNNSTTWNHVRGADGFDQTFNPTDKTEFYSTINQGARRFWNDGNNSTSITPPITGWFCTIRTHVSNENILFHGASSVQVSPDKGQSWTSTNASGSWALETCPSNSNRIYAAGASGFDVSSNGSLSRTNNQGSSWTSLHTNTGFPVSWNKITDIAVDPGNSNTVYVTFGGFFDGVKVYRSFNAGASWEDYSGSLPNIPINAIVVNAAADQVYIGTDLGVFYRHTSMTDWMPFNNSLPNTPVTSLYIDEEEDEIYVSTFGRGVWRNDLAEGCPVNLVLGGSMVGDHFYQSTNQITLTSDVEGGIATKAFIKAGNRVVLAPGFRADKNTIFRAYIGGCGEGDIPE